MNVKLRRPEAGDAFARAKLGYHPTILMGYGIFLDSPQPMPLDEAARWVKNIEDNPNAWVITDEGNLVGTLQLHQVNRDDGRANLAIGLVDPNRLNQGIGREAIRQFFAIAFGDLGLHRISVRVLASNERALNCYKACGFRTEGKERESARVRDHWEDDILLGILSTDVIQI